MAYIPTSVIISDWSSPLEIGGTDSITNLDETVNSIITNDPQSLTIHMNSQLAKIPPYLTSELSKVNVEAQAATAVSASAAAASASEAATSANSAENSDISAENSATIATQKALEASSSATSASNSEATATTKASEAATSATNAANSATSANISRSNANVSSIIATTKASEATISATDAATSASNASTSDTNAANSATNAANSAISAANSVDNSYARDGSKPLTADFAGGGYKITNIINGTASSDGATYEQVGQRVNKAGDTMTGNLELPSISVDGKYLNPATEGNYIIDGRFDFWYEGTSQTTSGYGSDTMWSNSQTGSTKTHSRQAFTVGGSFPDGTPYPAYYSRTTVTSVAAAGNYVLKGQKTEDVTRLAGKTGTVSFYAKADAAKNIAIELIQSFGTGGSPSTSITGIAPQKIPLTTVWQKFTRTITIPSISGKTLGTDGVHTSSTGLYFWFDAGSNYNSRTDNLGQQSGTFDIARVKLEEGTVATPFGWGGMAAEEHKIRKYYREFIMYVRASQGASGYMDAMIQLSPPMRVPPTTTIATPTGKAASVDTWAVYAPSANELRVRVHNTAAGDMYAENMAITADARLA